MLGHAVETVMSVNLSTLATYMEAGACGICMLMLPLADEFWLIYRSLSGPMRGKLRILQLDKRSNRASPRSRP